MLQTNEKVEELRERDFVLNVFIEPDWSRSEAVAEINTIAIAGARLRCDTGEGYCDYGNTCIGRMTGWVIDFAYIDGQGLITGVIVRVKCQDGSSLGEQDWSSLEEKEARLAQLGSEEFRKFGWIGDSA